MNDQVRNLVPTLMATEPPRRTRRLRALLELGVFFLATLSFVTALALTT
jgi:hypothetical protein